MITDRQSLLAYGKDRPPQVRPLWLLMLLMSNPNVTGSLKLPDASENNRMDRNRGDVRGRGAYVCNRGSSPDGR